MTRLIEKNTTIPTSKKEVFSTAADGQTEVTINVLQGEREFASDNRKLGQFNLTGIPPAPRGMPQIEVEFNIDANGILNVSATDKASGKSQHIEIKGSSGLSDDEIDRMKREAEEHSEEDKARRELIDLKNQAETVLHTARKNLEEYGDKVSSESRGDIEAAVSNLESKLKGDDKGAIEAALKQLESASMELGKAMYEAQAANVGAADPAAAAAAEGGQDSSAGQASTATADGASGKSGDDVIDAEYEVKDD